MLHVDNAGKLAVMEKPRGQKKAMEALLKRMEAGWLPDMGQRVIIGHGDDWNKAKLLQDAIVRKFPSEEIRLAHIGAHTDPGMLEVCPKEEALCAVSPAQRASFDGGIRASRPSAFADIYLP